MPADRAAAFRTSVANRLREGLARGEKESAIIAHIVAEQVAMSKVLASKAFIAAAANAYAEQLANLHGNASVSESEREIASIFANRIADAKGFILMLDRPEIIAAIRAEAAQPAAPAVPYQLPERKNVETVRRLVQSADVDGPEPAVHVAAGARGQQLTHEALAALFKPEDGPLHAPLVHALAIAWPTMSGAALAQLAGRWLKARYEPAFATSEALKESGSLYQEAMKQAEALQQQKLKHVQAVKPAAAPALQVSAPVQPQGKLATPDLMMDAI